MSYDTRRAILRLLEVEPWVRRAPGTPVAHAAEATLPSPEAAHARFPGARPDVAALDWTALAATVAACTRCSLHRGRTQTVFGVGSRTARLMVVGEAPGAEEDRQGEPFVGRAGQLLNAMLQAIGLGRHEVYIANVLKCRPPHNRDPKPDEVAHCKPYLARQIELIDPRVILCVGRIAAQNLLGTDAPLGRLRGRVHRLGPACRPVVVTYHPAYLLRSPAEKGKAWQDLVQAVELLAGATPAGLDA